ncbi:LuxR family transcriptional regulator [Embleya scabrispora]|uniref:LuxR family transcriptional regulator n=1 Tax=Embleya scabrispora TaxID=159449 RepID=A0A1T3NXR8_9ACTN|nr:LuxR family transcriptional regulator [Embleya scabrispora]OPC81623.1 LuxR family transcriptional regulator [Embleya scabrispora]
MDKLSLRTATKEQLASARSTSSGRSSVAMPGGSRRQLRQTLIALTAGNALDRHENPGEASLIVLTGHIRLSAGDDSVEGTSGDLLVVPEEPHTVEAVEDSAVILTVGTSGTTAGA